MGRQKELKAVELFLPADKVAMVEELVQSHEDKPQTPYMVRETARETGIHRSGILE